MTPTFTPSSLRITYGSKRCSPVAECTTFAETYGKIGTPVGALQKRTVRVVATVDEAQELGAALVEFVVAGRADHVAVEVARHGTLAALVRQGVQKLNRRLVLQQRGGGRPGAA